MFMYSDTSYMTVTYSVLNSFIWPWPCKKEERQFFRKKHVCSISSHIILVMFVLKRNIAE